MLSLKYYLETMEKDQYKLTSTNVISKIVKLYVNKNSYNISQFKLT